MGSDIYCFAEYVEETRQSFFNDLQEPASLFAQFCLSRDYQLFDALGNGRSDVFPSNEMERRALYPLQGLPSDVDHRVASEYYDIVADDEWPDARFWSSASTVTSADAHRRVVESGAHRGRIHQGWWFGTSKPRMWDTVSKVNMYNPTWLYVGEVDEALKHFGNEEGQMRWDFRAMLTCVRDMQKELPPESVRLVLWFGQ